MYFLPRIALVCATVVLISCKSNETDSAVDVLRETSAENQEKWFCQMAEDNPDAWDCVQDDVLAENPIPDRIPEGTLEKEQNDPASIPVQNETRGYPKGLRPSEDGLPSPPDQILNTPNPNASPPLHEQLSYRPDQDRNLEDLPSDFYTIQLLYRISALLRSLLLVQKSKGIRPQRLKKTVHFSTYYYSAYTPTRPLRKKSLRICQDP